VSKTSSQGRKQERVVKVDDSPLYVSPPLAVLLLQHFFCDCVFTQCFLNAHRPLRIAC
jgi:hypothetical protein